MIRALISKLDAAIEAANAADREVIDARDALGKARLSAVAAGSVDIGLSFPAGTRFKYEHPLRGDWTLELGLDHNGFPALFTLTKSGERHGRVSPRYVGNDFSGAGLTVLLVQNEVAR